MNRWLKNPLVWRPIITVSDATPRRLWENLREFRDVSEKTSLINLPGELSQIYKSVLFEMYLRRFMRRLKDASEMHPCWLGISINLYPVIILLCSGFVKKYSCVTPAVLVISTTFVTETERSKYLVLVSSDAALQRCF